jgi:exonuclease SbcC
MLVEVVNGVDRPVANGVHEVNQRIEALLGLSYDAFQQAVVLPQGQFDQFLRSDPGNRRDILRALLRLEVYERMRETALERARSLAADINTAAKRLDEDFASLTDESVEALRQELVAAEAEFKARTDALAAAEAEVGRLRPLHDATRECADIRTRLRQFKATDAEIARLKVRIERSRAASAVMPKVLAAEESGRRAATAAARVAQANSEVEQLGRKAEKASAALESARAAHAQVPALQDRLGALDGVLGILEHRDSLTARITKAEEDRRTAAKLLDEHGAARRLLAKQFGDAERAHRSAVQALAAVAYDKERHLAIETCRDAAADVAQLRKKHGEQELAAARATKGATEAVAKAEKARRAADRARVALDKLDVLYNAAVRDCERAKDEHAAAHLRETLEAGAPCPVCEQVVQVVPPGLAVPALQESKARVDALEVRRSEAQTLLDRAEKDAAVSQAVAERCAQEQREAEQAFSNAESALNTAVGRLSADLAAAGVSFGEQLPEQFVFEDLSRLDAARKQHDQADRALRTAEQGLADAKRKLELAERDVASVEARLVEIDDALSRDRAELQQVTDRIAAVCPSGDPAAERNRVAKLIGKLTADLKSAVDAMHDAERQLEAARATASEAQRIATEAGALADRDQAASLKALADAGFADAKGARAALLPDQELKSLVTKVEDHERERGRLQDRLDVLLELLKAGEVSLERMSVVEASSATARQARDNAVTRTATLRQRLETAEQRLATAKRLRAEKDAKSAEHAVADRLASDLRSDAFQEYLLQEVFQRLVLDASARLRQMTSRYTLEWDEGDFVVVDHDNAGERRSAQTLSGGETFLTSLSLALALSEQVQRTAGAVGLDSLFIDEGFGTLDADTLDVATEAIESLQVGGRMVGIISHIKDLTERMPACIVIDKRPDGSRWCVARS